MLRSLSLSVCIVLTAWGSLWAVPQAPQSDGSPMLSKLGAVVEKYVERNQALGGELLVIQDGKSLFHQSYGFSNREDDIRWENDSICNIRSMTKPITSAAAQILIDQNKLSLDEPVAKYLSSFDNDKSRAITVRQVLTHRSGLPVTSLTGPYQYSSLSEQVAAAGEKGPEFEPGSKFWYSDTGTDVVGALVAKVSEEPLHQFVKREILDPLEMTNSFYGIDADDPRFPTVNSAYMKGYKGKWVRFWRPSGKPLYPFAWGSQTIYSTTSDYAKFLTMLMNEGKYGDKQVLSERAVKRMLAPVSRAKMMGMDAEMPTGFRDVETYYGQMMISYRNSDSADVEPEIIGHSGSDGTIGWAWPDRNLVILYFTQSRGGLTPLRIEEEIDRFVLYPGADASTAEIPEEFQPYVGTFVANFGDFNNEEMTVKVKSGKLILDVPSQLPFELIEPDGSSEVEEWAFAVAPGQIKVTFQRNEEGQVVGLTLHKSGRANFVPRKGMEPKQDQEIDTKKTGTATTWKGTLDAGVQKLRLEIEIVRDGEKRTGQLTSVDQNNTKVDITDIVDDGKKLSFSVPQAGAKFSGKINEKGDVAVGTFTQGGQDFPLTLTGKESEKKVPEARPEGKLKEAWVGELDLGGVSPVMQFRLVELESGETVVFFDSVTEGRTGFEGSWSIEEKELIFDVPSIRLTYRGTLNEMGDVAEGIWSQGGREFPLTLKRQEKAYGDD